MKLNTPICIVVFLVCFTKIINAQVSVPERSPIFFGVRGGMISNNGDLAAQIRLKTDYDHTWAVNTYYAAAAEAVLGIDVVRLRTTDIVLHISALAAEPELRAKRESGDYRVANSQLGIARAAITFSFNNDNYKMFGMPWHTNHEAILGITGSFMYSTNIELSNFAKDTLGIESIKGDEAVKSLGVTFGWNWRIADSGWVIGLHGSILWFADDKPLLTIETGEASLYNSDKLTMAPRILQAGIGYHF
ncbi:MAG: hypothetical protein KA444_03110 [Bacteroidia bacterium]|nr:hypothetical protein [Bacteroidia bacterium]